MIAAALFAAGAAQPAGSHVVTVYTVASGVSFINTADDRARGAANNPFTPPLQRLRPKIDEVGVGPFPGDVAVYTFNVFADAKLKQRGGTASYTCYFNYTRHALCMAYYNLTHRSGTILAAGPVNFDATSFTLVVTGGTNAYLGARGQVSAVPAQHNAQRIDLALSADDPTGTTAASTVYAVASTAQFMNHADDRVRGMSTNPFNIHSLGLVIFTKGVEKGNGPFPGDDVLYTFKLYSDASLTRSAGSAIFTCYYNFVKHAICDSYFALDRGLVLAAGPIAFNSTKFSLSVTGGTSTYAGALGEVDATPAAGNAQRMHLRLEGVVR